MNDTDTISRLRSFIIEEAVPARWIRAASRQNRIPDVERLFPT